jgi:hypothetical protein
MGTIIHPLLANHSEPDISAIAQVLSLQQDTGHVKNYGQGQEVPPRVLPKADKENISIFVE